MDCKKQKITKPYYIENKNALTYVKEDCTLDIELIEWGE